jgi:hypothetical protein
MGSRREIMRNMSTEYGGAFGDKNVSADNAFALEELLQA